MLIYKQRYKPRTTREFTKSDLTVYDSAGNTALNALTVYGKSEVVDGAIKSAGEGYAVVDLGTLTWEYIAGENSRMQAGILDIKAPASGNVKANIMCAKYATRTSNEVFYHTYDKAIAYHPTLGKLWVYDTDYTDPTAFKNSLNGVILAYEESTPTDNTIAVKTDNGTGVNGTMATFTTGTPLRGIPDTTVRDVMAWDGSSGEVTKKCNKVRLADLTWVFSDPDNLFTAIISAMKSADTVEERITGLCCSKYKLNPTATSWANMPLNCYQKVAKKFGIKDANYNNISDFVASLGDAELVYELATPTTEQLSAIENANIAALRTFEPQTHAQNNAQTDMTVNYTIRVPTI